MKPKNISTDSPALPPSFEATQKPGKRILRIQEVESRVGFKRAYIYRLIRQGKFPQRCRLGVRAVGWDSQQIEEWIEQRLSGATA